MKILMLTSDFYDTGHGGVEGHILGMSRAFQEMGHSVTIVRTARREIQSDYDAANDGVDYVILDSVAAGSRKLAALTNVGGRAGLVLEFLRRVVSGFMSVRLTRELAPLLADADVVHQHNFLESWGLTRRVAKSGTPVVWTNHLGEFLYLRKLPFGKQILRWLTRHYAVSLAPSAELADQSAIAPSVHLIENGVDRARFHPVNEPERAEDRQALEWPDDLPVVLVPRRWAPTKGVIFAAEAMGLAAWPRPSYVVFAGSGTAEYPGYAAEVREFLKKAQVPFEMHDRVDQATMAKMLRCADACVIPSVKEATSLSALEAMSSGVVVVAANVGGLPELIEDGVTGFLHAPECPKSIAETLGRALAANDGITAAAKSVVDKKFSWEAIALRTMQFYPNGTRS